MIKKLINKRLLILLLLPALMLNTSRLYAGIPTIDIANIVQTTTNALQNIQQVQQLFTQIDNQIKAFENLNGDYLKDQLLNSFGFQQRRRWAPETYQDLLDLYKNGGGADGGGGGEFAKTTNAGWAARDELEVSDADLFYEDLDTPNAKRWQQHEINSMAAVGLAETGFERVTEIIEESEALLADISNSTDAKAAQDLGNRLLVQNQLILAEIMRIQSAQGATQGRKQLFDHAMQGEEKKRGAVDEVPSIL
jgi:conjugal transfer/entry exclusion protein